MQLEKYTNQFIPLWLESMPAFMLLLEKGYLTKYTCVLVFNNIGNSLEVALVQVQLWKNIEPV